MSDHLPTQAVRLAVDKMLVVVHRARESRVAAARIKNDQVKWRFLRDFFCRQGFDLPPKSVGASVDKMFAFLCSPYKSRPALIWLKYDQLQLFAL